MSDLISRQDAIDALWKALHDYEDKTEKQFLESEELNTDDWFQHRIFVQNMSDIDRQTILNLPSAQQWIPCSERMPEEAYECLVTIHVDAPFYGEYERVYYELAGWDGECWNDADGCTIPHEVTAWMPSPKPYNTEREV